MYKNKILELVIKIKFSEDSYLSESYREKDYIIVDTKDGKSARGFIDKITYEMIRLTDERKIFFVDIKKVNGVEVSGINLLLERTIL